MCVFLFQQVDATQGEILLLLYVPVLFCFEIVVSPCALAVQLVPLRNRPDGGRSDQALIRNFTKKKQFWRLTIQNGKKVPKRPQPIFCECPSCLHSRVVPVSEPVQGNHGDAIGGDVNLDNPVMEIDPAGGRQDVAGGSQDVAVQISAQGAEIGIEVMLPSFFAILDSTLAGLWNDLETLVNQILVSTPTVIGGAERNHVFSKTASVVSCAMYYNNASGHTGKLPDGYANADCRPKNVETRTRKSQMRGVTLMHNTQNMYPEEYLPSFRQLMMWDPKRVDTGSESGACQLVNYYVPLQGGKWGKVPFVCRYGPVCAGMDRMVRFGRLLTRLILLSVHCTFFSFTHPD